MSIEHFGYLKSNRTFIIVRIVILKIWEWIVKKRLNDKNVISKINNYTGSLVFFNSISMNYHTSSNYTTNCRIIFCLFVINFHSNTRNKHSAQKNWTKGVLEVIIGSCYCLVQSPKVKTKRTWADTIITWATTTPHHNF